MATLKAIVKSRAKNGMYPVWKNQRELTLRAVSK